MAKKYGKNRKFHKAFGILCLRLGFICLPLCKSFEAKPMHFWKLMSNFDPCLYRIEINSHFVCIFDFTEALNLISEK